MSVAKQLNQNHCLLLAIHTNHQADGLLQQLLLKKYPNAFTDVAQLVEMPKHCAQNICIVITNNTPLLVKELREKFEVIKKGTFFWLSLDPEPFKMKGPVKKLIEQHHAISVVDLQIDQSIELIRNHFKLMQKAVKIYVQKALVQSQKRNLSNIDFLNKLSDLVKKHHINPKLRTPFIAKQLGISQSTLERRCIKLTGKKPNHLLLEYRLGRAYELAANTRISFSEIAHNCGFGSPSYFSVRFTEFYKLKPSHIRLERQRRTAS